MILSITCLHVIFNYYDYLLLCLLKLLFFNITDIISFTIYCYSNLRGLMFFYNKRLFLLRYTHTTHFILLYFIFFFGVFCIVKK